MVVVRHHSGIEPKRYATLLHTGYVHTQDAAGKVSILED